MTKAEERAILEKIVALINSAGPDSYIATAFQGCVADAELNIADDAAYSYYDRYQTARNKLEEKMDFEENVLITIKEALTDLDETLTNDLRGCNETILDFCETPTDARYLLAVSRRKNLIARFKEVCRALDALEAI